MTNQETVSDIGKNMVLENCEPCMNYWIKSGRVMYGYKLLFDDKHIPEAHPSLALAPAPATATTTDTESSDHGPSEQCQLCMAYWLKKGRNFVGYQLIVCGHHIPEAHTADGPYSRFRNRTPKMPPEVRSTPACLIEHACVFQQKITDPKTSTEPDEMEINASWHLRLCRAAMDGDWDTGKPIFDRHGSEALSARIRASSETALHVAVGSVHDTLYFVQELLKLLLPRDLEVPTKDGCTPLGIAAKVGNLKVAKMLVAKHPPLVYITDGNGRFPIHIAAEYGQKEMLSYMLQVTEKGDPYDQEGRGPELLRSIIKAELYEAALLLLQLVPELATSGMTINQSLLILAQNPSAFSRWGREGVLLPLIVACVPEQQKNKSYLRVARDIENAVEEKHKLFESCCQRYIVPGLQKIHLLLWWISEKIAPFLKHIKSEKLKGVQARKLVKCLCREAANHLKKSSVRLFKMPLLLAAENGVQEIVEEITYSFPDTIFYPDSDSDNGDVFRLGIINRHHEVYNLLWEMGVRYVDIVKQPPGENEDNILHLAGYLAPSERLRAVSGAALQMQRELQWFKEIESLVQPAYKSKRNRDLKTPQQVFTETHQKLMEAGEEWMRNTANSGTVPAALIATIAFAAAITVPGGNSGDNGNPMFGSQKAFIIFGVADALSLFTSSVSILMFLSILTSRYAEGDFLRALPTRLIIGLLFLFISVASMTAAFSSVLYLMFGHGKKWILVGVIAPSCLLVAIFVRMQFSLLAEIFTSTYCRKLFKRSIKSKSPNKFASWSRFFKKRN